jgi:hypothetical protein
MEVKRELKPEIALVNRNIVISVADIAKLEIGLIPLLETIVESTETEKDDALLATIKPVLKMVLDAVGKEA